jgi:Secretion system C-terminal sorting domain
MLKNLFITLGLLLLLMPQTTTAQQFLRFYEGLFLTDLMYETANGYRLTGRGGTTEAYPAYTQLANFDATLIDTTIIYVNSLNQPGIKSDVWFLNNGDLLSSELVADDTIVQIKRLRPDNELIWSFDVHLGESSAAEPGILPMIQDVQGNFYLHGYFREAIDNTLDVYVCKLSAQGQLLWQRTIDRELYFLEDNFQYFLQPMAAGDCAILSYTDGNNFLTNLDDMGHLQVVHPDGSAETPVDFAGPYYQISNFNAQSVGPVPQTSFFFNCDLVNFTVTNVRLNTLDENGNVAAQANLSQLFQTIIPDPNWSFLYTLRLSDGNYLVWGISQVEISPNETERNIALLKITPQGSIIWATDMDRLEAPCFCNPVQILERTDGNITVLGYWTPNSVISEGGGIFLLGMNAEGQWLPHLIEGSVAIDDNNSCTNDTLETTLPNWLVQIDQGPQTQFRNTLSNGRYTAAADTGEYQVKLLLPNALWVACDNPQTLNIPDGLPATSFPIDFSVQAEQLCPLMKIEIGIPALYLNQPNRYIARYCNEGTAPAENATLTIAADPTLNLLTTSAPYQLTLEGIVFELGTVLPGQCGEITLDYLPEGANIGDIKCIEARITPNEICNTTPEIWSGASLELRSLCDGDSIRYQVKNTGNAPCQANLDFIIADDHVVMRTGQLPVIPAGNSWTITVAATGQANYMLVEQEPNRPELLNPSLMVFDCGSNNSAGANPTQVPMHTGSAFSDTECRVVQGQNIQPVFTQTAFPTGIPPQNVIGQSTKIDYWLEFSLNDTVSTLTIADTIPAAYFDMSTFQIGAATHQLSWHISSSGVLYLTLTDEQAFTNGFVMWTAVTKAGLDTGTVITNRAALWADASNTVTANSVFHTIGQALTSSIGQVATPQCQQLRAMPNPAMERSTVTLPEQSTDNSTLILYNALGQAVQTYTTTGAQVELHRNGLSAGYYHFKINNEKGSTLGTGGLIWR